MTIIELKDQIIKNSLTNFYIFTGDEIGIINIYLEQMSNKLNMPICRTDSVAQVIPRCSGDSLFGSSIGFYVVRDDKDFLKHEDAYTSIEKILGKNVLVLLYDKIDSRLKFGKHFKDRIVTFEKLTPTVLKSYIKRALPMSDENTNTLMEVCNYSYDVCMLEIDKITHYMDANVVQTGNMQFEMKNSDLCFQELINDGTIYQPETTDIWKFVEAVCNHNCLAAFELEEILRKGGTSSVTILGTLYNTLKNVMLIQCCDKYDNVSEVTGLDNKQIYFNKKYVGKYKIQDLVYGVKLIIDIVSSVKSGGIEDEYATRYILSHIM